MDLMLLNGRLTSDLHCVGKMVGLTCISFLEILCFVREFPNFFLLEHCYLKIRHKCMLRFVVRELFMQEITPGKSGVIIFTFARLAEWGIPVPS